MGSPTNSPVRLGVSPAAATATGFFSAGSFLSLCWDLGLRGLFHSPVFPLSLSARKWGTTWVTSHYLTWSTSCRLAHPGPLLPSCLSSPLLPVWMNVSSLTPWLLDFLTTRFSGSSCCFYFLICCCPSFGCVRRHSVSTYVSILARSQ